VTNNRNLTAAPALNSILIYRNDGQEERRVRLQRKERPQFIIVTSADQSKVGKFPLLHPEPEAEGDCNTLVYPTGVCADHLSLIYVCNGAMGSEQITVLSPQGESFFGLVE